MYNQYSTNSKKNQSETPSNQKVYYSIIKEKSKYFEITIKKTLIKVLQRFC